MSNLHNQTRWILIGLCVWVAIISVSYADETIRIDNNNPAETAIEQNIGQDYKIAVLAFRGEDKALRRWTATADYLSQQIPNSNFTVVPMGLEQLKDAVANKRADFVLTNTGQYVELEAFYGISRIATVKNDINGKVSTVFGAVIFTRADRDDINTIKDLKGKRFMGVKLSGFGGFQMAWREMKRHGIDPFKDLDRLQFSGFPQDDVAYAVRDGVVDIGTFRSETLETLDREGKINLSEFKVIHQKHDPEFKMLHSTELYPVWPFARASHTPRRLSEQVATSLINMPPDHPAAKTSKTLGWTIPVNYQPVHELMRELKVGPYKGMGEVTLNAFLQRYWKWLSAITLALILLAIVTFILRRTNRALVRVQDSLKQHQTELVHTVHARTSDLVVMRDQALAASEAKSAFLSKVSHELRTPLNAIIGYTEVLMDEFIDDNSNPYLKELRNIRVSALHLLSIITDILDITRLEKGSAQLRSEQFSVSKLIGDVMSQLQMLASKNGNRFEIRNHLQHDYIESDKERIRDALLHVLNNACKYTSEGVIGLDIKQIPEDGPGNILFRVSDNGIGMSVEQQEKIFNVFVQGDDSTTRQFDGLGLGLAKSRGYCRLMGGDIIFESEEGKGSVFEINIPVKFIDHTSSKASA